MSSLPVGLSAVLFLACIASTSASYTICVLPRTPSYYSAEQICSKLGATHVSCVIGIDRLDCMKKMSTGEADFAVFEAEDLLIAADDKHLSDMLITHKIHATNDKKWEFGVVALVSNKASISSLSDLKGKRLCHPGNDPFSSNYDWNEVFSLYFEERVVPQTCDKDLSIEENRVKALAGYFGESCKPGVWASDPKVDAELKTKYKSMCGLCDVPSVCSQRDKYWGRQGALYCLSDCLGDVAWSILKDAKLHFSTVGMSVCSDVSLLCPDGSTMPLNFTNPCVWITRPVPVIAAKRTRAEEIQMMLSQVLKMPDTPDDFIRLLESNVFYRPLKLSPSITPTDYLATAPGFLSANTKSACGQNNRAINLCVNALEDKIKCEWLAAVSKVYGLQPSINCIYGANCLVSVANKTADVAIASTDKLMPAMRDYSLKPLLVQLPIQLKRAKTVSAVVWSNSKIKKLSDLERKKACFPSIDGIGWTAFTMAMQKTEHFKGVCPFPKAMSKFFSKICLSEPSSTAAKYPNIKMCSMDDDIEHYDREMTENISYDNEAIAFHCLAVGGGDVAFISTDAIPKYLEEMKSNPEVEGLSVHDFRALCEGTSPNQDCHLNWASYSQVLVHTQISPSREEDVRTLFTGLNNLFGHQNTPSTRTFNMFAGSNSLFDIKDTLETAPVQQRLVEIEDFLKKAKLRPKNYETSVISVEKCSPSSAVQYKKLSFTLTFIVFVMWIYV